MNILVTGAAGFIGRYLVSHLESSHSVYKIVSVRAAQDEPRVFAIDLTDKDATQSFFRDFTSSHKVDSIIHLASRMSSVDGAEDIRILYDNIRMAENVAEAALIIQPQSLANISSMSVYPNRDGRYSEVSQIDPTANPDCWYGLSKFMAERVFDHLLKDSSMALSHLRVGQVYGDGMRQDRVMPVMVEELKRRNTITVYGNGERVSNFIEVGELVNTIAWAAETGLTGVYNVGRENLSYLALAKRLISMYGNNDSKIILKPEGSRAKFELDCAKINSKAGIKP